MKKYLLFFLTIIFSCFYICFTAKAVTITLSRPTSENSRLPEGGTPSNTDHYNTFELTLDVTGFKSNKYYDIEVKLTSSEYEGYAANFEKQSGWDLKFNSADYPSSETPQWEYKNKGKLFFNDAGTQQAVPSTIYVRCYDWGAYGTVTVTVKEDNGWFNKPTVGVPKTISIPKDDNNNRIADAWEKDENKNYNAFADDENVPQGTYTKGDGWTVYEEYRGLFLTSTATESYRLNPNKKNVLICYESANIQTYGTGAYSIHDSVSIDTIENHSSLINNAFENIHVIRDGKEVLKKVDKAGWVNQNSKGVLGRKLTNADRVWAIRVVETTLEGGRIKRFMGDANEGSPSCYSKIRIHTANIRRLMKQELVDKQVIRSDAQRKKDTKSDPKAAATKDQADDAILKISVDIAVNFTLSHEIGHSHALAHCSHNRCVMLEEPESEIDQKKVVFKVDGINAGHDLEYAATNLISSNMAISDLPQTSTPSNVTYSCGIHSGPAESESSDHRTTMSGWSGTFYECQPHTTYPCGHTDPNANAAYHALQASCLQTNSNGQSCTVTNFYDCGQHTHVYPVPVIICARRPCDDVVSRAREHWVTCSAGHEHWSCHPWHENHHRVRTCRRTNCGQTWQRCSRPSNDRTPDCLASPGNKCAAIQ